MKESKLSVIAFMYMLPIICAIVMPFRGVLINDEPISAFTAVFVGLFLGMCLEGFLLIVGLTFAVLMGKLD